MRKAICNLRHHMHLRHPTTSTRASHKCTHANKHAHTNAHTLMFADIPKSLLHIYSSVVQIYVFFCRYLVVIELSADKCPHHTHTLTHAQTHVHTCTREAHLQTFAGCCCCTYTDLLHRRWSLLHIYCIFLQTSARTTHTHTHLHTDTDTDTHFLSLFPFSFRRARLQTCQVFLLHTRG